MKPFLFLLLVLFSFDSFSQSTVISELEADFTGNRFLRIVHGDRFFDVWGENYAFSHTDDSKGPKKLSLLFIKNSGKIQERKDFWIEDGEYRLTGKVNDESTWEVFPNHPYNQIDQEIESADLETRKKLIFQQLENELGQEKLIKFKLDFTDEELRSALNLIPSDSWYHGEIGTYLTLNESTRAKIGEPAPDFSLESKSGEMFQLSEQKGKYTLLEFSYTGCPYCFLAIPELRKFHDEMGDQIQVVSLWKDQTKKIWLESQSDHKSQITWTNVWDPNGLSSSLFDIKIWPSYVLIDPEGKVKSIWSGYKKGSSLSKKIQREISL
ncbi:MAG: redoxin domain-containing protein [Cytophagales bacterium]|uniref:Thioredoxin domain-containing protein n=1 Tax=Algoriphagus taiwanensis TaxID=1445656 RepID=A0ABQ6Q495_9BACT|nr:MAG: redoxin domain-containing protein [Cytophagales bacterium]GMQ33847.1 hypothetical protein Ataiwa_21190 [Algoriphagus taiwanensis]